MAIPFSRRLRKGFDHYFRSWYPALCFFASRLTGDIETAKEISSTAFMKTWTNREKLNSSTDIRAYLYQVARRDCYKWIKRRSHNALGLQEYINSGGISEENHLEEMMQSELLAFVLKHLNQLPTGSKFVLSKIYIEGKTVAEIAEELHLAASTIKTQKVRGLEALRRKLGPG